MFLIYVCIGYNEILFFIRVLFIEISYPYCPRLLQFLYPFLKRFLNMIEIFKCFYGQVNGNLVEIEQILIGNQQTFFFGKWTAWTAVSPLFLISDMMMSFGDHGRAPRNFLRGIAFDAITISYSVVFDGKDAFLSCVTSTSGNTIIGR